MRPLQASTSSSPLAQNFSSVSGTLMASDSFLHCCRCCLKNHKLLWEEIHVFFFFKSFFIMPDYFFLCILPGLHIILPQLQAQMSSISLWWHVTGGQPPWLSNALLIQMCAFPQFSPRINSHYPGLTFIKIFPCFKLVSRMCFLPLSPHPVTTPLTVRWSWPPWPVRMRSARRGGSEDQLHWGHPPRVCWSLQPIEDNRQHWAWPGPHSYLDKDSVRSSFGREETGGEREQPYRGDTQAWERYRRTVIIWHFN